MFVLPQVRTHRPVRSNLRSGDVVPSLAQMIDRLLDDASMAAASDRPRSPTLDVDETDRDYLLKLDVPGVDRERLKVTIEGRRVSVETLEAEAQTVAVADDTQTTANAVAEPATAGTDAAQAPRALYRERSTARYARTVSLPKEVSSEHCEARLENGVLTLRLPKRVADGARRLTIS